MWDNFKYFLDRTLPVCEKAGVKMALHPNDPPAACVMGVPSLIYNSDGFKRAFELAGNSPYLGMKLCVGCWLEAGEQFGNPDGRHPLFCGAGQGAGCPFPQLKCSDAIF
ncbi:MAG: mannonate dehydratase [Clostridium sp.]